MARVFLVTWSEGDPTVVLAANYAEAVKEFIADVVAEDDETDASEVEAWILSVSMLAEKVVYSRANY